MLNWKPIQLESLKYQLSPWLIHVICTSFNGLSHHIIKMTINHIDINFLCASKLHVFNLVLIFCPDSNDVAKYNYVMISCKTNAITPINSFRPNDTIWRQSSGSTSAQVMAPSHYLNQCLLIISEVQWHIREISQEMPQPSITKICLKISYLRQWCWVKFHQASIMAEYGKWQVTACQSAA